MIKNNLKNKLKQAMYRPKRKEKENPIADYLVAISKDIDEALKILKNASDEEDKEGEEAEEASIDKKDTDIKEADKGETKSDDKKA